MQVSSRQTLPTPSGVAPNKATPQPPMPPMPPSQRRLPWKRVLTTTIELNEGMIHELQEWSPSASWLCTTTYGEKERGQINFFTNSGVKNDAEPIVRNSRATCISWHPTQAIIAVGWDDGEIVLTSPRRVEDHSISDSLPHKVSLLRWSHNGKCICAVYQTGEMILYSFEIRKTIITKRIANREFQAAPVAICSKLRYDAPPTLSKPDEVEEEDEADMKEFNAAMRERERKLDAARMGSADVLSRTPVGSTFLVALEGGIMGGMLCNGEPLDTHKFDSDVIFFDYYQEGNLLLVMMTDMMLLHAEMKDNGMLVEKVKVKLTGKGDNYKVKLIDNLLLFTYNDREMRVWDLEHEENGTISLQNNKGFDGEDYIICATYSKRKGLISAGTHDGKVASWRRRHGETTIASWRLQSGNQVGEKIRTITCSPLTGTISVNTGTDLIILQDDHALVYLRYKIAAVNNGPTSFTLLNVATGVSQELKIPFKAKGIVLGEKQLAVWNADTILTYDVQSSLATILSTQFNCVALDVVMYQQALYIIEGSNVNIRTLQGTVRQIISLPEMEGDPVMLHLNRSWLVIATTNGFLRVYDLSKRELQQEYNPQYIIERVDEFYKFLQVKINISGTRVACTFMDTPSSISDYILVWDAESDTVGYFSFDIGMTDQQQYETEAELANTSTGRPVTAAARKMEREQSRYRMMLHRPGTIHWDENDPRYLVCEAIHNTPDMADDMVISMFVTAEHGIQLQDLQKKSAMCDTLIGISVPNMYFIKRTEYEEEEIRGERTIGRLVVARSLREFAGLENCDEQTRRGMMDFCFYLTLGHMDEAFKAIHFIKSESVWEHMATMSVKTRRLDVAAICLGNMKNIRGARALRKAAEDGESDTIKCAVLAMELGMLDEAEALYASAGRYDMVNKIAQSQNNWNRAFEVASRYDRIHLRNTHYNYAQYLEAAGKIESAIENYERSGTHHFEIPRMFMDNPKLLEAYIRKKREPELHIWWARYLESIGELDGAVNFYQVAKDNLSVVRIRCLQGKYEEAASIAEETKDKAACYHLARIYEGEEDHLQAVNFFTKAHAFSSAIRIAKEHEMRDKLANLCLMAGGSELVEAARYYEDIPGYAHQAVMLYHKAGMIGRALDLAFRTEQFSALDLVAKDLDSSTDPTTLKRAAEFFTGNQNYEKAVELLCMAKDFRSAIELCRQKKVRMTEAITELMTPTKETVPNADERKSQLESVAELCTQQGAYQFAAKKYTQAGEKLQAMRALLKSGDTQKIRFFANTARSKEIYILAANYLQNTDWHGDATVIKDIETFYTRAQAHEHLARFYKACAFMEVENWNDFEKADDALEHSLKCITKARESSSAPSLDDLQREIDKYQSQLKKLTTIQGAYSADPTDAVRRLQTFADESTEDDLIRPAYILSLLIKHHAMKENWQAANKCIGQLRKKQPNLDLTTILDKDMLDKICDELKIPRVTNTQPEAQSDDEENQVDYSFAMKKMQNK